MARRSFLCAWVVSRGILDFVRINRVLLEFLRNKFESILEPEGFPFKGESFLKIFKMLDRIFNLFTRSSSFPIYRIDILTRSLVSESHRGNNKDYNYENVRDPSIEGLAASASMWNKWWSLRESNS
jgi:hypothetical protein